MIMVHSYQADPKYKHIRMTCRACVQPPPDLDGIYARIDTKILKTPQILLVHLVDF